MKTKHYLPNITTKGIRAADNGYEYGEWYQLRFTALGKAATMEEAMEKNGMSTTTAPDMRKAWRK